MRQIQQFAQSRLMQIQLDKATTLGGQAHKELINAIASLPPASQRKLVADDKLPTLRALMNSTDKEKLKTIFGGSLTDSGAQALVDENLRLAGFKQIQNAALAKVLANFEPKITLLPEQIQKINTSCASYSPPDITFQQLGSMTIPLILFGGANASLTAALKLDVKNIKLQQISNLPLLELYYDFEEAPPVPKELKSAEKALLDVFFRLNASTVKYEEPLIENLNKLLGKNHQSAKNFIDSIDQTIVKDPQQREALQKALTLELSEAAFVDIQKDRRKALFAERPNSSEAVLTEIADSLNQIKTKEKAVLDSASQLKAFIASDLFVVGSKDMAFGPAFDAMVKQRPVAIKAELDTLLEKNIAIVEYLSDNKMRLTAHLESLPAVKTPPNKETEKLRTSLNAELKTLSQKLEQYVDALKQIKTLVGEVNRVVGGKEDYVYHSAEIKHSTCSEEDLQKRIKAVRDRIPFTGPSQSALVAEINPLPDKGPVKSEIARKSALAEGHAHHISEVETISKRGTQNVVTQGSYAQTYFQGTASTGKDGQVNRAVGCRVEQIQGPTVVNNPSGPPTPVSADAKATYYLNMAMSLLVANGGKPPTKDNPIKLKGGTEDEMRLLWTALMIVGKESKIKFGKDEIKILTGTFDPDKEMTSSWRGKSYAETSAHEQIFKVDGKFPPHVKRKIEDANEMATTGKITVKALEKTVPNTTAFKGMFEAQKSTGQKVVDTVANKISPPDIAVDILKKLVDDLPQASNPEAQLATRGLTG